MAGHAFKVLFVHPDGGTLDIQWDGDDTKVISCATPIDDTGELLTGAAFEKAIMDQCVGNLERWDKIGARDHTEALKPLVGQSFDVTEAFTMRNVE